MEVFENLKIEKEKIEKRIEDAICPFLPILANEYPNFEQIKNIRNLFKELYSELKNSRKQELMLIEIISGKITKIYNEWKIKFDAEKNEFSKKLLQLGISDKQALSTRLNELKANEFQLENKIKPKHDKLYKDFKECIENREKALEELIKTRKLIHDKRAYIINEMSKELEKGDVKIEINENADKTEFFNLLDKIYEGSNIYNRIQQLENICMSITPIKLWELISKNDLDGLIDICNVTAETAKKIIDYPKFIDRFRIQVCPLHDELIIKLKKSEIEDFSPLKDLSYGEKCTAVFSIALLAKKKPLLVDQPEDELDHAFIINNIVEHIRKVKEERQLIIATHNANIPVLGDAELIFKVAKVPGIIKCKVDERGAFEKKSIIEKLQDLEGGPDAFKKRKEKYGLLE